MHLPIGADVEVTISNCLLSKQNGYIKGQYSYEIAIIGPPFPGEGADENLDLRTAYDMETHDFFVKE